jgi:hypothetical protein
MSAAVSVSGVPWLLLSALARATTVEGVPDSVRTWHVLASLYGGTALTVPAQDDDAFVRATFPALRPASNRSLDVAWLLNRPMSADTVELVLDLGETRPGVLLALRRANPGLPAAVQHRLSLRLADLRPEDIPLGLRDLDRLALGLRPRPTHEFDAHLEAQQPRSIRFVEGEGAHRMFAVALGTALGPDPDRWSAFLALAPTFDGTVAQLLRALDHLSTST